MRQVLAVEKTFHHPRLVGNGILRVPGLRRKSVPQQIERVDAVAAIDELRDQVGPVRTPAAQTVHQQQGAARASYQVVHLVSVHRHKLAAHAVQPQPGFDLPVDQPQRMTPGQDAKTQRRQQQNKQGSSPARPYRFSLNTHPCTHFNAHIIRQVMLHA